MDLIYWRHPTVPGIKVEEISGGESLSSKLWLEMALQIYSENGRDSYREIGHFKNGAPFLYGETSRISVTHCKGLLAIATLPPTPESDLSQFSERAAMGIDAEPMDRSQVLKIRDRFLSDKELEIIPMDDLVLNIQAWTIKEAVYKAALTEGLDFRKQIVIERIPRLGPPTPVFDPLEFGLPKSKKVLPDDFFGEARIVIENSGEIKTVDTEDARNVTTFTFKTYSYVSENCIVTLAYSPRCAKFGKSNVLNE